MTQITQDNLYFLLPSKVSLLAKMLDEDTGMGVVNSIRRIYKSNMYRRLEIEETKLWYPKKLTDNIDEWVLWVAEDLKR